MVVDIYLAASPFDTTTTRHLNRGEKLLFNGKGYIGTQFNTNLEDQCLGSIFIYLSTCPVLVALPPAYIKLVDTRTRKPPHHTMVMFPIKVKLIHQAYKWYP